MDVQVMNKYLQVYVQRFIFILIAQKNKTSTNIRDHWKCTQYHSKCVHQIKTPPQVTYFMPYVIRICRCGNVEILTVWAIPSLLQRPTFLSLPLCQITIESRENKVPDTYIWYVSFCLSFPIGHYTYTDMRIFLFMVFGAILITSIFSTVPKHCC